jgi:hypothetical protein
MADLPPTPGSGDPRIGGTVRYRGDVWWIHDVLPWGNLVIRNHPWRWWPFSGVMILSPAEVEYIHG